MLFDSTVRRELARNFGATLVVILTIVLTMMLIRTLGLAAGGSVAPQDVVLLLGYAAMGHLPTILNLSLFIAVVATLSRMYRESEMAIWFASGVGLTRFVRPVLGLSWPVLLAVTLLAIVVWPWGNRNSNELRERYERRGDLSRVVPGQYMSSRDGSRVFFIERGADDPGTGRNVFILMRKGERESVTSAKTGHVEFDDDDRFLVLEKGHRNEVNEQTGIKSLARFEEYRLLVGDRISQRTQELPPKATDTLDLLARPTPRNLGELTWRLGLMLGGANLLLLGLGLGASNPRRPSNWNLLFALLAFVVYFNLINLTRTWVANGRASLGVALAVVHGTVFLGAVALLWWRDHGTAFAPLRKAKRSKAAA